jgi:superfamily II DNA/RNA helicase
LVFAQRKQDVDAIHEYLLLKGVEAVAVHGGKGIISFYLKDAILQKD